MMVLIGGFGNPLLDISVKILDSSLLIKHNLNKDGQKVFTEQEMKLLLKDISHLSSIVSPGGCTQNTLRIIQWILDQQNATVMFGSIGEDERGSILKELVKSAGVQTMYTEHVNKQTGVAVALTHNEDRSLVAYLGVAQDFEVEDLETKSNMDILQKVNLIYMEAFFITNRIKASKFVQELCHINGIIFVFNLSAPFMSLAYPQDMIYFAKHSDILIGNYKEFEALSSVTGANSVLSLAQDLCKSYDNVKHLKHEKIVIITNGSKSVLCLHSKGSLVEEFIVPKLDTNKIGDTTGAGDAFAAGFLCGLVNELDPIVCLKWGCWTSQQIIQQVGCTIPNYSAIEIKSI